MNSTPHLVAAEDLGCLLELCGTRVLAGAATRRATRCLEEAATERARELAITALGGGGRLTRAALLQAFDDGGVVTAGQRGYHLLWYLAQTGTLCLGPTAGGAQLVVLADEWIPKPRRLGADEAPAELALRFFRSHGPATVADLTRWSGLTRTTVRAGLALARPQLDTLEVDGVDYLLDPATPDLLADARREARGGFLLPGFDEFVLGYGHRSAILDAEFAERIVPGGNGMFRPTVVSDGRIVGTWRRSGKGARRALVAEPFTDFPDAVRRATDRRAAALP